MRTNVLVTCTQWHQGEISRDELDGGGLGGALGRDNDGAVLETP